jgi:hypothetical protein
MYLYVLESAVVFQQYFSYIVAVSFILFEKETRGLGENHWPVASHWQTLSYTVVSSTPSLSGIRTHNVRCDKRTSISDVGKPGHGLMIHWSQRGDTDEWRWKARSWFNDSLITKRGHRLVTLESRVMV